MEFLKLAKERYAVRKFDTRMVEPEKLKKILEAGMAAPTAKNQQPQRVYVLQSNEAIEKIRSLSRCAYNAPVVLMLTCNKTEDWKNPLEEGVTSGEQDISIVATHMMLQACELGIGSCWVNFFSPTELKKAFELPAEETVVLLMPLGYPAEDSVAAPTHELSKEMEAVVKYL